MLWLLPQILRQAAQDFLCPSNVQPIAGVPVLENEPVEENPARGAWSCYSDHGTKRQQFDSLQAMVDALSVSFDDVMYAIAYNHGRFGGLLFARQ